MQKYPGKRIDLTKWRDENYAGIYCILNVRNRDVYVGQAKHIGKRLSDHKRQLKKGNHCNPHLQNAWNLYGESWFEFFSLEYIKDMSILDERERYWFDELKARYNIIIPGASMTEKNPLKSSEIPQSGDERFVRPEWHKWVYGGEKNPNI